MKAIFDELEHVKVDQIRKTNLLDTCFIIYALTHPKELRDIKRLKSVAITSFNVEEILHLRHKLKTGDKHILKRLIKEVDFKVIDIDVHPGERVKEREFVESYDSELLKHIADPSDAILAAVALRTHSKLYTRDKHHLFTTGLKNYLAGYYVKVLNIIK
ncbi:PIN domain-containing protein [Candidatus Woesearchaeota archaeon]|nr:PIN domain-containing protein [Candidatus Woesearchaeota archaeon]